MTKQYSGLLKVTTVLLAVVIMIINLYPLIKGVELFASARTVTNILFITLFSLTGITKLRDKNKSGFYYLAFVFVMLIIFLGFLYFWAISCSNLWISSIDIFLPKLITLLSLIFTIITCQTKQHYVRIVLEVC